MVKAGAVRRRTAFLLTLFAAASTSQPLVVDHDASLEVREAASMARLSGGEVALVIRGGVGSGGGRGPLLRAVGPADSYLALYYHRKTEKATLETGREGETKAVWWEVLRPHAGTLVLSVSARGVRLHAGCARGVQHASPARRDLLKLLSHHSVQVFHEEDSPMEVYSSEKAALNALGCETKKDETEVESDIDEIDDAITKAEAQDVRTKRQDGPVNVDDYVNNYIAQQQENAHRGDQPSSGYESCDEVLIRELIRLRQTIDGLRSDIADQNKQIESLRQKQDQCCRTREPAQIRCSSGSCYPGY